MKIGIIRHFKVDCIPETKMNAEGFRAYNKAYDVADVIKNEVIIDQNAFQICYCSDMKRAIETAKIVYKGKIIEDKRLREVPMDPIKEKSTMKNSSWWSIRARMAWLIGHSSQKEGRKQTRARAQTFIDQLDSNQDILIVSHAFFMITFIKMLKKNGFRGKVPLHLKNGTLYILEK